MLVLFYLQHETPHRFLTYWSKDSAGKCFHNRFHLFSPTLPSPGPPCSCTSLSFQHCIVTLQHCSLLSSGKINLTLSKPASLICDRGGMNKGSKEPFPPFFPSLSGYIYSGSLWFGTIPHANYKRRVSFDLWNLSCWIWAITATKSFSLNVYKGRLRTKGSTS